MSEKMLVPGQDRKFGFTLADDAAEPMEMMDDEYDETGRIEDIDKAEVMAYAARKLEQQVVKYRTLGMEALVSIGSFDAKKAKKLKKAMKARSAGDFEEFSSYPGQRYITSEANQYALRAIDRAQKADSVYDDVSSLYDALMMSKR